jgi:transcriptional regulator with XRE-family HTH domain
MTVDWQSWGLRLQGLRRERGWSQEELAARLHVARNTVNRWEMGDRHPSIEMLEQLATVFKVAGSSLLPAKRLRGQDTTESHRFIFDVRQLFPLDAAVSLPLARLMMATDDVRHIQRLLMVQHDPKNATTSEKAIIEGEVGHLFRLLCGHLCEALDVFGNLDQKCRSLLHDAVQAPSSEAERARANVALERVRRAREDVLLNRRSFISVVRNHAGFHYPREQTLESVLTKCFRREGVGERVKGQIVLTNHQGFGRYSVTDDLLKLVTAQAVGGPLEHFRTAYQEAIGDALKLAGAVGDVVDYLLRHLVNSYPIQGDHAIEVVRIHPRIVELQKQQKRKRRRRQA